MHSNEIHLKISFDHGPGGSPGSSPSPIAEQTGKLNQFTVTASSADKSVSEKASATADLPLAERKITVDDYRLAQNGANGEPPSKLKKLAGAIALICRHIKENVSNCLSAKWLFASGVAGSIAMVGISVAAMAGVTGGISVATVLPSLMAGGAAAPVGFIGGVAGGLAAGAGYGTLKGIYKSLRDLPRSAESRFLHHYKDKEKQLKQLEGKIARRNDKESHRKKADRLRTDLRRMEDEYQRLKKESPEKSA